MNVLRPSSFQAIRAGDGMMREELAIALGVVGREHHPEEDQLTVLRDAGPAPLTEGLPLRDGHHPLDQRQDVHLLVVQMFLQGIDQLGEGVGEFRTRLRCPRSATNCMAFSAARW